MSKILVIDDERAIRNSLKEVLEYEEYTVEVAATAKEAEDKISKNSYDLIITDLIIGEDSGIDLFKKMHKTFPDLVFLVISGHVTVKEAVELIRQGAYDLLEKPFEMRILLSKVKEALEKKDIYEQTKKIKPRATKVKNDIIGDSKAILNTLSLVDLAASTDAKVLITGENGSGKELLAQRVHKISNRANFPFVEVNCAAIPSELIESELFGHEKGSFTSACKLKKGKFEQADGGTLFLDEIGDMSLSAQAKLLRAIQEMKISRVGSEKDIAVDVRIVAATNKNLLEEVEKGNFRLDLYHRLNVLRIKVPSLEQRKEDIPLLINHFLDKIKPQNGCDKIAITSSAIKALQHRSWPGNIRELSNIVERLVIFSQGCEITEELVEMYAAD